MSTRSRRRSFHALSGLVVLAALQGCSSRPDIVGHNSEAEAWAEEQRRAEAEERNQLGQRWPQQTAPENQTPPAPASTPQPQSHQPQAQPSSQPQAQQPQAQQPQAQQPQAQQPSQPQTPAPAQQN